MGLNAEPIIWESRFWEQVNILAKEAFPPEEYLAPSELVKIAESDNFDFLALHEPNPFAATGLLRSCFRPRLKRALRENQPHPQETVSNPVFQKKRAIIMKNGTMRIGLIGLGIMGKPMAKNMLKPGIKIGR